MIENYKYLITKTDVIDLISVVIVLLCTLLTLASVYIDFSKYHKSKTVKKATKSIVETGSMFLFFIAYYLILKFRFGSINTENLPLIIAIKLLGNTLLVTFCYVGIKGRFDLKDNWANQVTIYETQKVVKNGMYSYLRHPLYTSLIWMFTGACFVYLNYLALISVWLIFVPFMYYRAKQEEKLLMAEFKEYQEYRNKVGMFFFKF